MLPAGGLLLDNELLGPALTTQLSLLASFDSCNLKHLSMSHMVQTFLPRILPAAWRHKPLVQWSGPEEGHQSAVTWWVQPCSADSSVLCGVLPRAGAHNTAKPQPAC